MTREAKIGMLTGLGVIVLIGVLLSNYLGDAKTGAPMSNSNGPTDQMADLGVGDGYRQQVMRPIGVPAMAASGARTQQLPNGAEIATPMEGSDRAMPPAAFAVEPAQIPAPVTPLPAGPMVAVADTRLEDPPIISLADPATVQVKVTDSGTQHPAQPAPTVVTYTVAQGDSLGKIAKKFYNSSKASDVQRIVAANPGVLKDASSMLVIGKKLVIPGVAPAAAKPDQPMVYPPGDAPKTGPMPAPPSVKTNIYVVQSGDTLEKISRRLSPNKVSDMVQKLISLNSIKDPANLQVGTKLKVPA